MIRGLNGMIGTVAWSMTRTEPSAAPLVAVVSPCFFRYELYSSFAEISSLSSRLYWLRRRAESAMPLSTDAISSLSDLNSDSTWVRSVSSALSVPRTASRKNRRWSSSDENVLHASVSSRVGRVEGTSRV